MNISGSSSNSRRTYTRTRENLPPRTFLARARDIAVPISEDDLQPSATKRVHRQGVPSVPGSSSLAHSDTAMDKPHPHQPMRHKHVIRPLPIASLSNRSLQSLPLVT